MCERGCVSVRQWFACHPGVVPTGYLRWCERVCEGGGETGRERVEPKRCLCSCERQRNVERRLQDACASVCKREGVCGCERDAPSGCVSWCVRMCGYERQPTKELQEALDCRTQVDSIPSLPHTSLFTNTSVFPRPFSYIYVSFRASFICLLSRLFSHISSSRALSLAPHPPSSQKTTASPPHTTSRPHAQYVGDFPDAYVSYQQYRCLFTCVGACVLLLFCHICT